MKTNRQLASELLKGWETYPDEFDRLLDRISEGESEAKLRGMYLISPTAWIEWLRADISRWGRYTDALAKGRRSQLEMRALQRETAAEIRESVTLIAHMQRVSQPAWEGACRYLKISPVPERPKW